MGEDEDEEEEVSPRRTSNAVSVSAGTDVMTRMLDDLDRDRLGADRGEGDRAGEARERS